MRPSAPALLWHQTVYELRIFRRTPISAFFTIIFPLLIFVVFALVFGNEDIGYLGITTAQYYAPSLAVYSAVSASYVNIGITTAYQRDEGILKRARGTPLPPWIFLGGKITAATIVAILGTLLMLAVGVTFFGLQIYPEAIPIELEDQAEIFHTVFDLSERVQVPGYQIVERGSMMERNNGYVPHWFAVLDDKNRVRISGFLNQDLGDAWEFSNDPAYPEHFASQAYRMGVNYVVYSMTH